MKRIISIILVAVLCIGVLTGCQVLDQVKDLIGLGGNQPDVTVEAPTVDDALTVLHNIMKEKHTAPKADFDLVAQVIAAKGDVKGTFTVEWTCDDETIVIRESTKKGFVTVDLPDANDKEFEYTLTATVKDAEGNKASKSYTYTLPVMSSVGITAEPVEGVAYKLYMSQANLKLNLFAKNTTQAGNGDGKNYGKYIQTTKDAKEAADYYVEKVDGGYKWYTEIDGVKHYVLAQLLVENASSPDKTSKYIGLSTENSTVFEYIQETNSWQTTLSNGLKYVVGTYNTYDTICISEASHISAENTGSSQFVVEFMSADYAETLTPSEEVKVEEPANGSTITIAQALELGAKLVTDTKGKFYITGKVVSVDNTTYGNMYIEDENGNKIQIYGSYDATGANRFDAMATQPKVGDTITVYTVVSIFNNNPQLKNAWITAINGENLGGGNQGGDATAELGIVTNPEIGKAYKFGLFHGNEKATVYMNGQNYNNYAWYFAYSANVSDAVDVYLEAVEGVADAYRLFFYNGDAKTYVVAFPRDGDTTKGTLKFDTTCPTEYFTFSTEHNTLIYTSVTGEQFYLGSSGTYKSISCSAISYITNADSYVAHLYAEGATGEEAPHTHEFVNGKCVCGEVDPDYVAPDMPTDGVYTIPQVLAAAEGTEVIVTGTVESFYYDWDDNYGNCSVYIVDEAGNKLLCFRLKTKVAVGDNITVTGTVAVYNGTNQLGAGCTATINGSDSGSDDPVDPNPPAGGEMTIPEVLASAEGTAVVVKGTVCEIYQAWSDQYKNISFYITDGNGNRLLVFRTGTLVEIGDQVTVTGTATLYNEVVQIAQGGVTVIDVKHVCSDFNAADCLNAATCKVCGKVNGEAAGHNYVDGTCSACGATQVAGETVTASKTMKDLITELGWTSSTTKQTFNLDDNVTVKINGGSNTGKAYNGDHIRIYATDSPAGTITISVAEGCELVSIKVTTQTGTYAFLCVDGTTDDISNETVSVSGSSVTLNSVKNGSDGKQVRVMAIEVVYAEK